jgi:hypothetical protein
MIEEQKPRRAFSPENSAAENCRDSRLWLSACYSRAHMLNEPIQTWIAVCSSPLISGAYFVGLGETQRRDIEVGKLPEGAILQLPGLLDLLLF